MPSLPLGVARPQRRSRIGGSFASTLGGQIVRLQLAAGVDVFGLVIDA
jgi:hypothetical protein